MRNKEYFWRNMIKNIIFIAFLAILTVVACKRYKDKKGPYDPRLERSYCNDPLAVNYNWGFPGQPDSTVCVFPADAMSGRYLLQDSVYSLDNTLDSEHINPVYFDLYALSKSRLGMVGFCNATDTLYFTADRYYKAVADTVFAAGQFFCGVSDTLTGYFRRTDSLSLYIDFTVLGDTAAGIRYHRGTAVKQ